MQKSSDTTRTYILDRIIPFKFARLASYLSDSRMESKRMGAALALGKNVVAVGRNSYTKTHSLQKGGLKPYLHAEIDAIIKRRHYDDLNRLTLYVYREDAYGRPAFAKPCKQCMRLILAFGIRRVVYTTQEEPFYTELKL